jgi:hypothetical protein
VLELGLWFRVRVQDYGSRLGFGLGLGFKVTVRVKVHFKG